MQHFFPIEHLAKLRDELLKKRDISSLSEEEDDQLDFIYDMIDIVEAEIYNTIEFDEENSKEFCEEIHEEIDYIDYNENKYGELDNDDIEEFRKIWASIEHNM
jgi:hypothetical protein